MNIEKMKEMLEVQGQNGNWNYSEYMCGLYNGMEFMVALAEDREPIFKNLQIEWLEDKKEMENE